jgi:FkbM family methyltransferase
MINKDLIKKFFNIFGLEVYRLQPFSDPGSQILAGMKKVKTNIILDIGANTGQFASEMRRKGYGGKIISFEPLINARKELIKRSFKDPNWIIHEKAAIGNENGLIEINVSKNSVSSSILNMLESHSTAENNSIYIGKEKTPIFTLDSIAEKYLDKFSNCFVKIDTQGYEWQVIEGASNILKKSKGVICELSLVSLYENQRLWIDIIQKLEKEGFILWSLIRGFTDKRDGRSLQVDGVFLKKSEINN